MRHGSLARRRQLEDAAEIFGKLTAPVKHKSKTHSKDETERRRRRAAALKRYDQSPRGRYKQQKRNAKLRGIDWQLTYESWCKIWAQSGRWDQRGNWAKGYVMMRPGDIGPYTVGNVIIGRHIDNVAERNRLLFASRREEEDAKSAEWYAAEAGDETPEPEDPFDETPF